MNIFEKFFEENVIDARRKGQNYSHMLNVVLIVLFISLLDINARNIFDQLVIDYFFIFPVILAAFISRKLGFFISIFVVTMSFWINPFMRSYWRNVGQTQTDIDFWTVILVLGVYFTLVMISNLLVTKTMEARENQERLQDSLIKTTSSLSKALDSKDKYTAEHSSNVAQISFIIGKELDFSTEDLYRLKRAAYLHDIGKIGVGDMVLNKEGKLSTDEYNLIKQHSEIGYQILKDVPGLEKEAMAVRYHHERWDGTGYPAGLKENEIPLWSRILNVADSFDAMSSQRVYKKAMPTMEVIKELKRASGTQFDPDIIDAFLSAYKQGRIYFSGQNILTSA